jgi:hypothetical protein
MGRGMHGAFRWGNLHEIVSMEEDRIKIDVKEMCWEGMGRLYLAEERDNWGTFCGWC